LNLKELIYLDQGSKAEASLAFEEAIQLEPNFNLAKENLKQGGCNPFIRIRSYNEPVFFKHRFFLCTKEKIKYAAVVSIKESSRLSRNESRVH